MYSTGCPKCNVLKMKLAAKGIQFDENNSVDEMLAAGMTQAPMLVVNGEKMDFINAVSWVDEQ